MTTRTSRTDPLRLDCLPLERGVLAMTICPGKVGPSMSGTAWRRDLEADMELIRSEGVAALVTLMEPDEMAHYQVEGLGASADRRGIAWLHFPFPDRGIPGDHQRSDWRKISGRIHQVLKGGETVLIHCLGGLGRTGTVASMILQDLGSDVSTSIARLRSVRDGAVETEGQEAFLDGYAAWRDA